MKDNPLAAAIGAEVTEAPDVQPPPGYFRLTFEVDGKLFGFDGDATAPADVWMDKLTQLAAAVRHHTGYELWLGESEVASTIPEPPKIILPH